MSVTAVANNSSASLLLADSQSASCKTSASSAANSTKPASTSAKGAAAAESSTQVTLSPTAQILAELAAAGITFTMSDAQGAPVSLASLAGVTLQSQSPGDSDDGWAMQICEALATTGLNVSMTDPGGVSMSVWKMTGSQGSSGDQMLQDAQQMNQHLIVPPTSGGKYDGNISQAAFDTVINQIGGTKTDADQIFSSLDTDNNGSISNSELLSAMSQLGSSNADSGVQELEKLLVPDGDSTVTDGEFLSFETAMVAAEKPAT